MELVNEDSDEGVLPRSPLAPLLSHLQGDGSLGMAACFCMGVIATLLSVALWWQYASTRSLKLENLLLRAKVRTLKSVHLVNEEGGDFLEKDLAHIRKKVNEVRGGVTSSYALEYGLKVERRGALTVVGQGNPLRLLGHSPNPVGRSAVTGGRGLSFDDMEYLHTVLTPSSMNSTPARADSSNKTQYSPEIPSPASRRVLRVSPPLGKTAL